MTTINKPINEIRATESEQAMSEAVGRAWHMGRQTALCKQRYDNRFMAAPLKRSYAAGFISMHAVIRRLRTRVPLSERKKPIADIAGFS